MKTQDSLQWWHSLNAHWQKAFGEVFFGHFNEPSASELSNLKNTEVLRLAGPAAPYPNMSFELTDLSGISRSVNLKILVVTHQRIKTITELQALTNLKSLFLFNNQIEDISGIESLIHLEQLYIQFNQIKSLEPLRAITNLRELYVHHNEIESLDWLTEAHADNLENFFCKPNANLKRKEVFKTERTLGLQCKTI